MTEEVNMKSYMKRKIIIPVKGGKCELATWVVDLIILHNEWLILNLVSLILSLQVNDFSSVNYFRMALRIKCDDIWKILFKIPKYMF